MCCGSIVQEQHRRITGADGIRRVTGGRECAAYLIIYSAGAIHSFVRARLRLVLIVICPAPIIKPLSPRNRWARIYI